MEKDANYCILLFNPWKITALPSCGLLFTELLANVTLTSHSRVKIDFHFCVNKILSFSRSRASQEIKGLLFLPSHTVLFLIIVVNCVQNVAIVLLHIPLASPNVIILQFVVAVAGAQIATQIVLLIMTKSSHSKCQCIWFFIDNNDGGGWMVMIWLLQQRLCYPYQFWTAYTTYPHQLPLLRLQRLP